MNRKGRASTDRRLAWILLFASALSFACSSRGSNAGSTSDGGSGESGASGVAGRAAGNGGDAGALDPAAGAGDGVAGSSSGGASNGGASNGGASSGGASGGTAANDQGGIAGMAGEPGAGGDSSCVRCWDAYKSGMDAYEVGGDLCPEHRSRYQTLYNCLCNSGTYCPQQPNCRLALCDIHEAPPGDTQCEDCLRADTNGRCAEYVNYCLAE